MDEETSLSSRILAVKATSVTPCLGAVVKRDPVCGLLARLLTLALPKGLKCTWRAHLLLPVSSCQITFN